MAWKKKRKIMRTNTSTVFAPTAARIATPVMDIASAKKPPTMIILNEKYVTNGESQHAKTWAIKLSTDPTGGEIPPPPFSS